MTYNLIAQKSGNGAFWIARNADGDICVRIDDDAHNYRFETPEQAYAWCKGGFAGLQGTMRGFSYLNAAFELEDIISA